VRTSKDLKGQLQQKLVGHTSTVDDILKLYDIYIANLNDKERPVCSSLIVGPTGCGKTHLVRSFAYALHNDMNCMLRVDCGEFQQRHETARLIGAPPGYLGHRETEAVLSAARIRAATSKYSPISVILFDEIEKADVGVFDLLLNVLVYG
jgi:ATP-dependent Clp protease ATP-binding subunit ClpA